MKKVLTYGTFDLLHYGHIRILERAKALGDYLIVGVTADDFDQRRGKINVQQSLPERIESVRATGLADEIIIEEYEGQKIDDVLRLNINVFVLGSDWKGKCDYLKEFCEVVYLDRTEGISSSLLRSERRQLTIGMIGNISDLVKFERESHFVNGVKIGAFCSSSKCIPENFLRISRLSTFEDLLEQVDAVYIVETPDMHTKHIEQAILSKKSVICDSPISMTRNDCSRLFQLAREQKVILLDLAKTAYTTAYHRLLLLVKSGKIGDIISINAICTSQRDKELIDSGKISLIWNSICEWGPISLLPIFQLLGTQYIHKQIITRLLPNSQNFDTFTQISFMYPQSVATIQVAKGVKSEGQLIIAGSKGYIYVPAPWWKTDYFEVRFENMENNQRYYYHLDGEGIRYAITMFIRSIFTGINRSYIDEQVSKEICGIIEDFYNKLRVDLIY